MKLRYKLLILLLIPLAILLFYHLFSFSLLTQDFTDLHETIISPASFEAKTAADIRFYTTRLALSIDRAILTLHTQQKLELQKEIKIAKELEKEILITLQDLYDSRRNRATETELQLEELEQTLQDMINKANEIIHLIEIATEEDITPIIQKVEAELIPLNNELFERSTFLLEKQVTELTKMELIFSELLETHSKRLLIIFFISILIFLLLIFVIERILVRSIEELTLDVEEISKGNFEVVIENSLSQRKDEIGRLAKAFCRIVASMKLAILRVGVSQENDKEEEVPSTTEDLKKQKLIKASSSSTKQNKRKQQPASKKKRQKKTS